VERDLIARFFRQVDAGLWKEELHDEHAPLVLAGVDFLLPMYREISRYPSIVEEGVVGNPDRFRPEELHQRAWAILEPIFAQTIREDRDRYAELEPAGRTAATVPDILTAAEQGRVDVLFSATGEHLWGRVDGRVEVHSDPQPGDEDLLDLAAVRTLLTSGRIHAVEPDEVPGDGPVAAILRY
jgi:hypothetical protein